MAPPCFSSKRRMNICILLLGQKFINLKLVGTTTDNGKNSYGNIVISNESYGTPLFEPFLCQTRYFVGLTASCFAKREHSL